MLSTRAEMLMDHEQCLMSSGWCPRLGLFFLENVKLPCKVPFADVGERRHELCVEGHEFT